METQDDDTLKSDAKLKIEQCPSNAAGASPPFSEITRPERIAPSAALAAYLQRTTLPLPTSRPKVQLRADQFHGVDHSLDTAVTFSLTTAGNESEMIVVSVVAGVARR